MGWIFTPSASPTTASATSAHTLVEVTMVTASPSAPVPSALASVAPSPEQATRPMVRPAAAEAARAVRRKRVFMGPS